MLKIDRTRREKKQLQYHILHYLCLHFDGISTLLACLVQSLESRMYAFLLYFSPVCKFWEELGKHNMAMPGPARSSPAIPCPHRQAWSRPSRWDPPRPNHTLPRPVGRPSKTLPMMVWTWGRQSQTIMGSVWQKAQNPGRVCRSIFLMEWKSSDFRMIDFW